MPFDLTLPDGRVLTEPGNLFGVTEIALGHRPAFSVPRLWSDLKRRRPRLRRGAARRQRALGRQHGARHSTGGFQGAADAWPPTQRDAFTALVVMVPTMSEYFELVEKLTLRGWQGQHSARLRRISRLSDIKIFWAASKSSTPVSARW